MGTALSYWQLQIAVAELGIEDGDVWVPGTRILGQDFFELGRSRRKILDLLQCRTQIPPRHKVVRIQFDRLTQNRHRLVILVQIHIAVAELEIEDGYAGVPGNYLLQHRNRVGEVPAFDEKIGLPQTLDRLDILAVLGIGSRAVGGCLRGVG